MMMKHVFSFVLLGLGAAALGGCPIYSGDDRSNRVCVGSDCYSCPDPYISDNCYAFSCYGDTTTGPAGSKQATIKATFKIGASHATGVEQVTVKSSLYIGTAAVPTCTFTSDGTAILQ